MTSHSSPRGVILGLALPICLINCQLGFAIIKPCAVFTFSPPFTHKLHLKNTPPYVSEVPLAIPSLFPQGDVIGLPLGPRASCGGFWVCLFPTPSLVYPETPFARALDILQGLQGPISSSPLFSRTSVQTESWVHVSCKAASFAPQIDNCHGARPAASPFKVHLAGQRRSLASSRG